MSVPQGGRHARLIGRGIEHKQLRGQPVALTRSIWLVCVILA